MSNSAAQILSLAGALLVLAAYFGHQYAGMRSDTLLYGLLNLVGSSALASTAIVPLNAGVFLVEAAWAVLSLGVVVRALRSRREAAADSPRPTDGHLSP